MSPISWRGGRVCQCVKDSVEMVVEPRMRAAGIIKNSIDIFQFCYNSGGVAASAGTHDGGGALDVAQFSWAAQKIWRQAGWAFWHRRPIAGLWGAHGHGIVVGCPHASWGAKNQVSSYRNGRNGLANNGSDDGPRVKIKAWSEVKKSLGSGGATGGKDWLDMVSKAELEDVVDKCINKRLGDVIPAPPYSTAAAKKKNPNWFMSSYVRDTNNRVYKIQKKVAQLGDAVTAPKYLSAAAKKKNPKWFMSSYVKNTNERLYNVEKRVNAALGDSVPAPAYQSAEVLKKNPNWYLTSYARLTHEKLHAVQGSVLELLELTREVAAQSGVSDDAKRQIATRAQGLFQQITADEAANEASSREKAEELLAGVTEPEEVTDVEPPAENLEEPADA